MGKKSLYTKLMTESSFVKVPRSDTSVIANNSDASFA